MTRRHISLIGVLIVAGLTIANFFGATRVAGYEWYVGLSSARLKHVNYVLFIPVSSTVSTNALSDLIAYPSEKNETWELSVSRPLLRRVSNTQATGKALWLINDISQRIELGHGGSSEWVPKAAGYINTSDWDALEKYTDSIIRAEQAKTPSPR
jgi:hypothetical protein